MCEFEQKVLDGLISCGVELNTNSITIGAAISGGADSISLLISLTRILQPYKIPIKIITVNHNIRPAAESGGDANFVFNLCSSLKSRGIDIECRVVELARGEVNKTANERKGGIEEAARYLRYQAFENFISEYKIDYFCLAHNKNDQLETVFMRFLQGAGCDSLGGIKLIREKYIRPLLQIERSEIENYLNSIGQTWRTDSTNNETEYLRNKIRLKLFPFLDKEFPNWKNGVLLTAEKANEESEVITQQVENFPMNIADNIITIRTCELLACKKAIQKKILLKACNFAGENTRIPNVFLDDVIKCIDENNEKSFTKQFGKIEICKKNNQLFVKKQNKNKTNLIFFDIIEESGEFEFPFGNVTVFAKKNNVTVIFNNSVEVTNVRFPFCIRSVQLDDQVECADGKFKKVADVFSDWHVNEEDKQLIPVLQLLDDNIQPIKGIFASFLGYKDWIIK